METGATLEEDKLFFVGFVYSVVLVACPTYQPCQISFVGCQILNESAVFDQSCQHNSLFWCCLSMASLCQQCAQCNDNAYWLADNLEHCCDKIKFFIAFILLVEYVLLFSMLIYN